MIETVLLIVGGLVIAYLAFLTYYQRKINRKYHKLFNTIVESITMQQGINSKQADINELLGKNLEIVGVHTKLIPPSVTMQAEAFLRWHNERKEEDNG
jgi:hypothetical protein